MKKDDFKALLVLFSIFFFGILTGRYIFTKVQYIPETDASKKCKELGGNFVVEYEYEIKYDFKKEKEIPKSKPVFTCNLPEKELFKYEP